MATPLLISKADFAGLIDLPSNLDEARKLNPFILAAQNFDLCALTGDKFYYDMISKYNIAPYADFIAGIDYLNDGITYEYAGIKPVLVFFTGARLIRELDLHITPNAIMTKRNEFSDPVDSKVISNRSNAYENQALAYWNKAKKYLDFYNTSFQYWNYDKCGCDTNKSGYRPRMTAIGNNDCNYITR